MKTESKSKSDDFIPVGIQDWAFPAEALLAHYCSLLYRRFGTYEEVSRLTQGRDPGGFASGFRFLATLEMTVSAPNL